MYMNFKKILLVCAFILFTSCSSTKLNTVNVELQKGFSSPETAIQALVTTVKNQDNVSLESLLGPDFIKQVSSGDPKRDQQALQALSVRMSDKIEILEENNSTLYLEFGQDNFIFPAPLLEINNLWYFDGQAGIEEILNRSIGHNEISALKVLDFFSSAQIVYASKDRDGDGKLEYASRLLSTSGKQDGLYWEYAKFGEPSPLGPQVGQLINQHGVDGVYQGYRFQLNVDANQDLTSPDSVTLQASPVRYGISGVMSFIASTDGKIYEKNIPVKEDSTKKIKPFKIDETWKIVSND